MFAVERSRPDFEPPDIEPQMPELVWQFELFYEQCKRGI